MTLSTTIPFLKRCMQSRRMTGNKPPRCLPNQALSHTQGYALIGRVRLVRPANGDIASARQNIEKLDQARAGMVSYMQSVSCQMHSNHPVKSVSVQQLEAKAWLAWAEGKPAEALETMQSAVAMEDSFSVESR